MFNQRFYHTFTYHEYQEYIFLAITNVCVTIIKTPYYADIPTQMTAAGAFFLILFVTSASSTPVSRDIPDFVTVC